MTLTLKLSTYEFVHIHNSQQMCSIVKIHNRESAITKQHIIHNSEESGIGHQGVFVFLRHVQ